MNRILFLIILFLGAASLTQAQQRIVSLNGAVSEILCALGLETSIVGVDITSNYPASLSMKTKVGHNKNISAEGILALRPTLVLGVKDQIKPEVAEQLTAAHVKILLLQQEYSVAGTRSLLQQVAAATATTDKAKQVEADFNKQFQALKVTPVKKKVLFIYARGTGSMMVAGTGTPVEEMIRLAGAQNAVTEFKFYKQLSSESLIAANPDVILLFDSGLNSLGSIDGLLKVPGVAQTNAGRNKKVISMDGEFLTGFGLRLPQAIAELNKKLNQ